MIIPILYYHVKLNYDILILTFAYPDICKLQVALVWQEMLSRSGAPEFICFPFGGQIHFAMSKCE